MSRLAWVTPDDAPGAIACRPVYIPSGIAGMAALLGAMAMLADVWNWEQEGAQTPEIMAAAWESALLVTTEHLEDSCGMAHNVGEIFAYAGVTLPDGSLPCTGILVNKTQFAGLYAIIGDTWGTGDEFNFRLPDLRSRVLIGWADSGGLTHYNLADTGGEETHLLTEAELPSHDHTIAHTHTITPFRQVGNLGSGALTAWRQDVGFNVTTSASSAANSGAAGSDAAHENRPPYAAVRWAIWALP